MLFYSPVFSHISVVFKAEKPSTLNHYVIMKCLRNYEVISDISLAVEDLATSPLELCHHWRAHNKAAGVVARMIRQS